MRNLLLCAAALSLLAAPVAWADPHDGGGHHGGGGGGGHHGGGGGGGGGRPHGGGGSGGHFGAGRFGGGQHSDGGHFGRGRPANASHRIGAVRHRSFARGVAVGVGAGLAAHAAFRGGEARAAPGFRGGPGFARRGGGFVYNGSRGSGFGPHGAGRFSYRGRSFDRFRVGAFGYPAGWGYRSWGVGAFLPSLFLTDAYFIGNFGGYDLGPPAPGARWVRYGPDALLVDVNTGRVIDVVHGVFWW